MLLLVLMPEMRKLLQHNSFNTHLLLLESDDFSRCIPPSLLYTNALTEEAWTKGLLCFIFLSSRTLNIPTYLSIITLLISLQQILIILGAFFNWPSAKLFNINFSLNDWMSNCQCGQSQAEINVISQWFIMSSFDMAPRVPIFYIDNKLMFSPIPPFIVDSYINHDFVLVI